MIKQFKYIALFTLTLLISCFQKQKFPDENSSLRFSYENDELVKITDTLNNIEYFFADGDINDIEAVFIADDKDYIIQKQEFFENGGVKITYDEEFSKETIVELNSSNVRLIQVFHLIGDTINKRALVSNLSISHKQDTFDYFYLEKTNFGFRLRTDNPEFNYSSGLLDSLVLTYVEDSERIQYYSPMKGAFIPYLNKNKSQVAKNSYDIVTDWDSIVGALWGFYREGSDYPYSYSLVSTYGDVLSRIEKKTASRRNIDAVTINNKALLKNIIASKKYRLVNSKLVIAK